MTLFTTEVNGGIQINNRNPRICNKFERHGVNVDLVPIFNGLTSLPMVRVGLPVDNDKQNTIVISYIRLN